MKPPSRAAAPAGAESVASGEAAVDAAVRAAAPVGKVAHLVAGRMAAARLPMGLRRVNKRLKRG